VPNPLAVLINWLLTHLVAIGFLIFLLVGIYWRQELFNLTAEPALQPAQRLTPDASAAAAAPSEQPPEAPEPVRPKSSLEHPSATEQGTVVDPAGAVFRPVGQANESPADDAAQFVSRDALEKTEPDHHQGDPVDVSGLLGEARKTFQAGALENAESLYLRYLSLRPADASAFMELGDLYRAMGRPRDALDSYFEAGVRFKSEGNNRQLGKIVQLFLEAGDSRARQLHQ
jgi:tetratricopeptide (TPR) repeat protein